MTGDLDVAILFVERNPIDQSTVDPKLHGFVLLVRPAFDRNELISEHSTVPEFGHELSLPTRETLRSTQFAGPNDGQILR